MSLVTRWLRASILGALGVCFMVPASQAATSWIKAQSPHFTVYSDNGEKVTRAYLARLEQYRYVLGLFHAQDTDSDSPPLVIYFLNKPADLKQTWPQATDGVMGYYKDCAQGAAAFAIYQDDFSVSRVKDVKNQAENLSQVILFHEYAHTFMFQNSETRYPKWFVEGFAEFYSTTRLLDDTAEVGTASAMRIRTLMSLGEMRYDSLLRDKISLTSSPFELDQYYAQSWLLTHYIMSDPDRRHAFAVYVDAYDRGEDPVTAFESAFGIKAKDLSKTLAAYMAHQIRATIYRVHNMPVSDIQITPLPASASKLLLWDAAVRICPANDQRPALMANIQSEAAKYPGDDFAALTLARAQIVIGDETQAVGYLQSYTDAHPEDAESRYLLGETLYLMTRHGHLQPSETAESQMLKARTALGRAYQLNPLSAPALYYYSLSLGNGTNTENNVNAAIQAHNLEPSVDVYAVRAAMLLILRDRMDEAKVMLYPLANNPHNDLESRWATAVIAAIDAKMSKEDLLKQIQAPGASAAPPAATPQK